MRTLIVTALLTSVALVGCKKKTPPAKAGDQASTQGESGKTMGPVGKPVSKPALAKDKRPAPRPAVSTKPPPITGTKPLGGLERSAFVPADAIAYGSFDSQSFLTAAKPIIMLFFQMQADSSKSRPVAKVVGKSKSKATIKARRTPPKLTYALLQALAKRKYGIDVKKLGRVTVIGVVPPPKPKGRSAFHGEPVFLAPSAAFTPPNQAKPVETVGGVPLYAVTGRPTRSRIAVVGETLIFGETAKVKKVLAVRLGKAPRLGYKATLWRSIRRLRNTVPRAKSFMVLDFTALRKTMKGKPGAWEKELEAGGVFFTRTSLVALIKGQPQRIALAATLLKVLLVQARKALPMAQTQFIKTAGPKAGNLFDSVKFALKNVVTQTKDDTLSIRLAAPPIKVMTAVGMLTYFMLVRGRSSSKSGSPRARAYTPKAMAKPVDKPRPVKTIRVK